MLACWDETSESRPLFDKLEEMFSNMLHTNLTKHYVNLNEIYSKAEPLRVAVRPKLFCDSCKSSSTATKMHPNLRVLKSIQSVQNPLYR